MNSTIESRTATQRTTRTVRRRPAPTPVAAPIEAAQAEILSQRPASERTRLIFMALLGMAACIALAGVVSQAGDAGTSPDDPPPAVFVSID